MIYAALPFGAKIGWGILGKYVALELARMTDVRLLLPLESHQQVDDEFDGFQLRPLMASPDENQARFLNGPLIHALTGDSLALHVSHVLQQAHVGFAVFELNRFAPAAIETLKRHCRHLACGSTYCAEILRAHGVTDVSVVLHGVDTALFHPRPVERSFLRDRFVVFSGGKFEFRKGQDIVIRAYKVLQDRHDDVMLVHSWHNIWPTSRDTMRVSRLIRYEAPVRQSYFDWIPGLLAANGIDTQRVITVGPRKYSSLPSVYHATDLGLFPNRVEGGTNMVMMEYMACGKPVLASFNSGHTDVLTADNAVLIEDHGILEFPNGPFLRSFSDPDLEETVEKLEWCYQNRDRLKAIGLKAAADMREFTWKRVAEGLLWAVRQADGN